ncbi:hypothetical protein PLEOSDRAFT_1091707 [Pleurotus ostreatus PC15]|uniref:Uncharacterized protein n=1 Tax=Pleurotus ostreatus (strain PC15) TaxID=1137138 RepID=A0A067PC29_PLEO1|nr:hypothetical protein PLEOSDRAFT_1091707 [Pleurotus ostreatus PC15]
MTVLSPFVAVFNYTLQPIAPFSWFGLGISTLDVVAAFRLCLVLRQIRDLYKRQHVAVKGHNEVEDDSFVKKLATTLTVVYGGEAIAGPFLGLPPSFMVSGTVPALYAAIQALIEYLPESFVPISSFENEIPLAIVDGFTRAMLLCTLIPPAVTANPSPVIASSPWALLLTSLITANTGFFVVNSVSFLHPTSLSLRTPPELQAYGWTTMDLWCAPTITGLYALLTHAQPFWAEVHTVLMQLLGGSVDSKQAEPLDPETARALCAMVLSVMFTSRTVNNSFGSYFKTLGQKKQEAKAKTQ